MRINYYLFFALFFLLSAAVVAQKKVKAFSVPELKKGDLSSKAFKDFPEAKSRILFDLGKTNFIHAKDTFRLERSRHLRIKLLQDSTLSAHELGLTSFDHNDLIELIHYSLVDEELFSKEINSIWEGINKYTPLTEQIADFKPGDILEFTFKEDLESIESLPGWQFEYEIPVEYSEWKAEIPAVFKYKTIFKGYVPLYVNSSELLKDENKSWVEIDGFFVYQYHYACKDVAPFEKVVYSPSSKNYLTSVYFYLEKVENYSSYKSMSGQSWEQVSNQLYNDDKLGKRIGEFDASSIIDQLNLDTVMEHQIVWIYEWTKNTFKWNGEIGIYAEQSLDDLIATKKGSVSEINLLLTALLQEAGIPTSPLILRTSDQGEVNMELPSAGQFNYLLTWIDFKGKHLLLDASDPCLDIGLLRPVCLNNKGLKVKARFEEWEDLEDGISAKINIVTRSIIQDSKLVAAVNISKTNQFALQDCRNFTDINELIQVEKGLIISEVELSKKDSVISGNRIRFKCDADSLVSKSGSSWSFAPFWFEQIKTSPFTDKERKFPIVFPFLFEYNFSFILSYNESVSVNNVPKRTEIAIPDNTMHFIYEVKEMDGVLQVNAQLSILKRRYEASDYDAILKFYEDVYKMFNEEVKIKVKD